MIDVCVMRARSSGTKDVRTEYNMDMKLDESNSTRKEEAYNNGIRQEIDVSLLNIGMLIQRKRQRGLVINSHLVIEIHHMDGNTGGNVAEGSRINILLMMLVIHPYACGAVGMPKY